MSEKVIKGETDHCRDRLIKYCTGQGIDLGCGNVKIKFDTIGIDLQHPNADMALDARDLSCYPADFFDYVYSSHLLEELENTELALKEWLRVLKPNGHLVLYQADKNTYYPIGDQRCNQSHKHHFTWEELWAILEKMGGTELVHSSPPKHPEWSFELVVQKAGTTLPKKKPELNFKFMVVGGPAETYIERCLESIKNQNYPNWTAQVVLDPVGDETYNRALKFQRDKIKIKLNETRNYNVANFLEAAKLLNPADNDIMIMIDADDWLANPFVLSVVKKYYNDNPELLVTHGSWAPYPKPNIHNNRPYSEEEFKQGIRKFQWRGSHLKTFKYKVWKHLKEDDLRDDTGNFFSVTGDLALMYPLLEMAGYLRVKFIPEILYIYNQETLFSDDKKNLQRQMWLTDWLARKEPYKCLEKF